MNPDRKLAAAKRRREREELFCGGIGEELGGDLEEKVAGSCTDVGAAGSSGIKTEILVALGETPAATAAACQIALRIEDLGSCFSQDE